MRRGIAKILLLLLPSALVTVLLLELFFRFAIPASEVPVRRYDDAYGLMTFDPERTRTGVFTRGRFAEVRARWQINDAGWNSSIEYETRSDRDEGTTLVAIIGDSFVNGFQVEAEENLASVARASLGEEFEVYRFGMPGSPLAQYLQMNRYVSKEFDPDLLVFVVVHNDFRESIRELRSMPYYFQLTRDGDRLVDVAPTRPAKPGRQPLWSYSATGRYLYLTLQSPLVLPAARGPVKGRVESNVRVDALREAEDVIREATFEIVGRIARENAGTQILFVMDAPREEIYTEGHTSEVAWLNQLLREACLQNALAYLDLSTVFAPHYAAKGQRFEFESDAHWNALGHRLTGEAIAAWVQERAARD